MERARADEPQGGGHVAVPGHARDSRNRRQPGHAQGDPDPERLGHAAALRSALGRAAWRGPQPRPPRRRGRCHGRPLRQQHPRVQQLVGVGDASANVLAGAPGSAHELLERRQRWRATGSVGPGHGGPPGPAAGRQPRPAGLGARRRPAALRRSRPVPLRRRQRSQPGVRRQRRARSPGPGRLGVFRGGGSCGRGRPPRRAAHGRGPGRAGGEDARPADESRRPRRLCQAAGAGGARVRAGGSSACGAPARPALQRQRAGRLQFLRPARRCGPHQRGSQGRQPPLPRQWPPLWPGPRADARPRGC
mmetsp:Transcript_35889/g.92380  ORF Transcript_35889/g.92380 Transcript_35889/m.92380 type:complete len:305 (-) Transcript_35889:946-1860(-)